MEKALFLIVTDVDDEQSIPDILAKTGFTFNDVGDDGRVIYVALKVEDGVLVDKQTLETTVVIMSASIHRTIMESTTGWIDLDTATKKEKK